MMKTCVFSFCNKLDVYSFNCKILIVSCFWGQCNLRGWVIWRHATIPECLCNLTLLMMFLDKNWSVCVTERSNTREDRNINPEKDSNFWFQCSGSCTVWWTLLFIITSHADNSVLCIVSNLFCKAYAKMSVPSIFVFFYFYVFSSSLFTGLIFRWYLSLSAKCGRNVSDLAWILLIGINFSPYLSISKSKVLSR